MISNFAERVANYVPRTSCKGCVHEENEDHYDDKCVTWEHPSPCYDEPICMDDLEAFYKFGETDMLDKFLRAFDARWRNESFESWSAFVHKIVEELKEAK